MKKFQEHKRKFKEARGWENEDPAHITLHLAEEVGEVARVVNQLDGYKKKFVDKNREDLVHDLGLELHDVMSSVASIANRYGIDLEEYAKKGIEKMEKKYPVEKYGKSR